jgi:hypothetical protein
MVTIKKQNRSIMQKAKIYIAGKVTGLDYIHVSQKFGKYEKQLMEQGHTPVVPLNLCDKNDAWRTAMSKCIAALLFCDELHLLPCWPNSPGARVERAIALEIGMKIVYVK